MGAHDQAELPECHPHTEDLVRELGVGPALSSRLASTATHKVPTPDMQPELQRLFLEETRPKDEAAVQLGEAHWIRQWSPRPEQPGGADTRVRQQEQSDDSAHSDSSALAQYCQTLGGAAGPRGTTRASTHGTARQALSSSTSPPQDHATRPVRRLLDSMRSLGLVGAVLWGLHTDETKHTHAFVHQAGQPWVLTTDADDAR